MSNENDDRQVRMDTDLFTEKVEYESGPEEDNQLTVRFPKSSALTDTEPLKQTGQEDEIYITSFTPKNKASKAPGRPHNEHLRQNADDIGKIPQSVPAGKNAERRNDHKIDQAELMDSIRVRPRRKAPSAPDQNGPSAQIIPARPDPPDYSNRRDSSKTADILKPEETENKPGPEQDSEKSAIIGPAKQNILTSFIEKPQILLETPYSVLTKFGPRLRYRIEFGYPDCKIPDEEQSLPGDRFSPMELDAMNQSAPLAEGEKPISSKKRKSVIKEVLSWVKIFTAALILALLIRQFVFVLVWVEGSSMEPTLINQERIFVTRYDYIFGDPERQDIIICHYPDDPKNDNYVKRVIGLPGERISIDDGIVYINGKALEEEYVVHEKIQDMAEISIPEKMYFVMGDNRYNSRDSRTVGLISRSAIQGHVRYVFLPFEDRRSVN